MTLRSQGEVPPERLAQALKVYSVDSPAEAESLITLFCRMTRERSPRFIWTDWPGGGEVDQMTLLEEYFPRVTEALRTAHQRMLARRSAPPSG